MWPAISPSRGRDHEHPLGLLPEAVLRELAAEGGLGQHPEREVGAAGANGDVRLVQAVEVRSRERVAAGPDVPPASRLSYAPPMTRSPPSELSTRPRRLARGSPRVKVLLARLRRPRAVRDSPACSSHSSSWNRVIRVLHLLHPADMSPRTPRSQRSTSRSIVAWLFCCDGGRARHHERIAARSVAAWL